MPLGQAIESDQVYYDRHLDSDLLPFDSVSTIGYLPLICKCAEIILVQKSSKPISLPSILSKIMEKNNERRSNNNNNERYEADEDERRTTR